MDVDDNRPLSPSPPSPRTSKAVSPHGKNAPTSQHSRPPTPKPAIPKPREVPIIDLESPSKSIRAVEATPPRSEKSKGKMKAPVPPTPIDLSEDEGSDADMPSVEQLWQSTQARKSTAKAYSPSSSSLTPPPAVRSVRAREDESELDSPPAKRARRRRRAVYSADEDIDFSELEAKSKANGSLGRSVARSPVVRKTAERPPVSPKERLRDSLSASSSRQRLKARHSEPSPPSPHKRDATPSKVKASTSLENKLGSSKHPQARTVSKSSSARSVHSVSPNRTVVSAGKVHSAEGGGRVRRQAATKAAVSLAADVRDMNAFQADFARSKGDLRKLNLTGLHMSRSESTSHTTSTDAAFRRSSSSAVSVDDRTSQTQPLTLVHVQDAETEHTDADSDAQDSVAPPKRRTKSVPLTLNIPPPY